MQTVINVIGLILLWIGIIFSALGVLGLIRFPDVYCRLHASGKVSTLGLCGLLLGAVFLMPTLTAKAVALAIFTVISSPISTHAIALAAYRLGVPMQRSVRDDMGGHYRDSYSSDL
ncbi:MAG: monovalent cation/H(+) antiporter subunit G [Chloroflexota bacterium]